MSTAWRDTDPALYVYTKISMIWTHKNLRRVLNEANWSTTKTGRLQNFEIMLERMELNARGPNYIYWGFAWLDRWKDNDREPVIPWHHFYQGEAATWNLTFGLSMHLNTPRRSKHGEHGLVCWKSLYVTHDCQLLTLAQCQCVPLSQHRWHSLLRLIWKFIKN